MYTQCDKGYIRSYGIRWDFCSNQWNGIIQGRCYKRLWCAYYNIYDYTNRHTLRGDSSPLDDKCWLNRKLFEFSKIFSSHDFESRRNNVFWKNKITLLLRTPKRIRFRWEFRTSCWISESPVEVSILSV